MKKNMIYMVGALLSSAILAFSCSDEIPSYSGLAVDKSDLFIKIENRTATINVTEGNGNYKVEVADENIATARVEGDKVIFTAVKNGSTTATITDWAKYSTVIKIRVKEDFSLELDKQKVTLINLPGKSTEQVFISSGNDGYTVKSSDESIVTATMNTDGSIQVTYVSGGFAKITVTDADGKETSLDVASCDYDLTLDVIPMAVKTTLNNAIKIATGNGEYEVSSNDESVATAEIIVDEQNSDNSSIKVTGVSSGDTKITVTDKMGLSYTFPIKIRDGLSIETTPIDKLEIGIPQTITIIDGSGDYTWSATNSAMTCSLSEDKTKLIVNGAKSSKNQKLTFTDKIFNETQTIDVALIEYPSDAYHARWYVQGNFRDDIPYSYIETEGAKEHIKVGTAKSSTNNNALNGFHMSFEGGRGEGRKTNAVIFTTKGAGGFGIGGGADDKSFAITDFEIYKREITKPDDEKDGKGKFWIRFKEAGKEEYSYIVTWF